jgi:hypothetical protein
MFCQTVKKTPRLGSATCYCPVQPMVNNEISLAENKVDKVNRYLIIDLL